jgi:hypothetical protein
VAKLGEGAKKSLFCLSLSYKMEVSFMGRERIDLLFFGFNRGDA